MRFILLNISYLCMSTLPYIAESRHGHASKSLGTRKATRSWHRGSSRSKRNWHTRQLKSGGCAMLYPSRCPIHIYLLVLYLALRSVECASFTTPSDLSVQRHSNPDTLRPSAIMHHQPAIASQYLPLSPPVSVSEVCYNQKEYSPSMTAGMKLVSFADLLDEQLVRGLSCLWVTCLLIPYLIALTSSLIHPNHGSLQKRRKGRCRDTEGCACC